MFVIKM